MELLNYFHIWLQKNYRDAYGTYASNDILFNHESSRRGETFVTRKVINFVTKTKLGFNEVLYIANLEFFGVFFKKNIFLN